MRHVATLFFFFLKKKKNYRDGLATPRLVGLGVAEPPPWPLRVIWPLPRQIFFFFATGWPNYFHDLWGWFGHPQGPNPQKKIEGLATP
jgi:hypothetical protein